jgi:hypothetical protein
MNHSCNVWRTVTAKDGKLMGDDVHDTGSEIAAIFHFFSSSGQRHCDSA